MSMEVKQVDLAQVDAPAVSAREFDAASSRVKAESQAEPVRAKEAPELEDISIGESIPEEKKDLFEEEMEKLLFPEKEPSKKSIDSAFSAMNSKLKMQRTRCEYEYDEDINRVSIKIYDQDTDELVLEVPPEEVRDALKKAWELAGIIVDEKY